MVRGLLRRRWKRPLTPLSLWLWGSLLWGGGCTFSRPPQFPPPQGWQWREVAREVGVAYRHNAGCSGHKDFPETMGPGVALFDADGDGDLDLFFPNGAPLPGYLGPSPILPALYRNRGDGTFEEVTQEMGLAVEAYGMGCAVGDYDNDGWPDLYLTTAIGPNRLFHNEQGRRFREVTQEAGVGCERWSSSALWADLDNDGDLDLFVCNYVPWTPETDLWCGGPVKQYCRPQEYPPETCILYRNNGDGTFSDVSEMAGLSSSRGKSLGVVAWDYNRDGWLDLVVANDTEPDFLLVNRGGLRFEERGLETGIALSETGQARSGMGVDVGDLTGDGDWVVAVGNFSLEGLGLYRLSQGTFHDIAAPAGVLEPSFYKVTFGVGFVDFDLDGWLDLWATNGHIDAMVGELDTAIGYAQKPHCFRQVAPGRLEDWTDRTGLKDFAVVGRGVAWGDWDGDGDVDLALSVNQGPAALLRNDLHSDHHWLRLRLRGTRSNRDGYGALVRVKAGRRWQQQWVNSGRSYLSACDPRPTFGLGRHRRAEVVEVLWPSGRLSRLRSLPANQEVEVLEP